MKKHLQGIACILFGILLACADETINMSVLWSFSDFPFALIGLFFGAFGLYLACKKEKKKKGTGAFQVPVLLLYLPYYRKGRRSCKR